MRQAARTIVQMMTHHAQPGRLLLACSACGTPNTPSFAATIHRKHVNVSITVAIMLRQHAKEGLHELIKTSPEWFCESTAYGCNLGHRLSNTRLHDSDCHLNPNGVARTGVVTQVRQSIGSKAAQRLLSVC